MKSPRRAAVSILRAWAKGHVYAESLIERHASRNNLSASDRGLLNAIVLGVLRHRRLLDHWIGELRKGKLDHETRDILRVGLCQLLILQLPDHAAVFETVNLGKSPVRGLINAVMRKAAATKKSLLDLSELPPAIAHSHPDWLYNRWRKAFGPEATLELMAFNNLPAPTVARINPLAPEATDPPAGSNESLPAGYFQIDGPIPTEWLTKGTIYITDPATRHGIELLAPQPGEQILDACAAPGGKAFLIAAAGGSGQGLTCTDSNEKRLPRLRENLSRLHITPDSIQAHDWTQPAPTKWHGAFDAILLDVPCSNTGVFRRRVDVRWRLRPQDITDLTRIQQSILEQALPCLKPGGRLVYSTCSIEAEENDELLQQFVELHPDWQITETRQALPQIDGTDGAFAAVLRRRSSFD
ncbi:16S rRNA (cytosine967-C5)-methyltransferase [Haloferula luteola]|uniref:16S rRNA (Cytosine967-C5)-methyltransferase n=1 Tax=Haloferula luteola TaxID=595692 RepID=A0A840V1R0_9BACT|nr:transcription antitermination factor NusB [Haloferula luteola]MBB5352277.1 16S rRNA (cytosine967-C5)-methyltransferase [Haloferula luteola]